MAQPLEKAALGYRPRGLKGRPFPLRGDESQLGAQKESLAGGSYFSVPHDVQLSHLGAPQGAAFTNTYQTLLFQQK